MNQMNVKRSYSLEITFLEPLLGTRKDSKFDSNSFFYRDSKGRPILLDRHIMGFLKEAAQALNAVYGDELGSILTRKVFISPGEISLVLPDGRSVEFIDRPPHLIKRAGQKVETVVGTSEAAPRGTKLSCELLVYPGVDESVLTALLDYGRLKGIGLGRNQGFGKFEYRLTTKEEGGG